MVEEISKDEQIELDPVDEDGLDQDGLDQEDLDETRPVREYRIEDGMLIDETPEPEPEPKADERVAGLERELAAARADLYNYRQRVTRERQEVRRRAVEDALSSLLPVLDNLDRALAVPEGASAKDVLVGVRMVQRQFLSSLDELGVEPIPTEGERFDPILHEAVATSPVEDPEQDEMIVDEQLRGYRTKEGKVLRPARVTVGRVEQ